MTKKRAKQKPSEKKGGGKGVMGGFRSGMKSLVGQGPKSPQKRRSKASRVLDIVLWVAVLGLLIFLLVRHFG